MPDRQRPAIIAAPMTGRRTNGCWPGCWTMPRRCRSRRPVGRRRFSPAATRRPRVVCPAFDGLTAHKGEVSSWYSYREDHARSFVCRQDKRGNMVTWETVPLPENPAADRVTFVFAVGWATVRSRKTEGFVLEINGRETHPLRHRRCRQNGRSADKRVELRFEQAACGYRWINSASST